MSRIGLMPITVPAGTTLKVDNGVMTVTGPKGTLTTEVPYGIEINVEGNTVNVVNKRTGKKAAALHGFVRANLFNLVTGVSTGWSKSLELVGVGYRAALTGANLTLSVGFSHQVTVVPPPGITFAATETKVTVSGIDRQLVGQIAANVRSVKEPEPYKGKGIKYVGEHIRKKAGKSAKAVGGK